MKAMIIAAGLAAVVAAGCDRPPTTTSEYNNSGASATPAQNAPIATEDAAARPDPNLVARVGADASAPIGAGSGSTAPAQPAEPAKAGDQAK
jgi:hypothetical protein